MTKKDRIFFTAMMILFLVMLITELSFISLLAEAFYEAEGWDGKIMVMLAAIISPIGFVATAIKLVKND
jgi:hypothetical protein